MRHDIIIAGVGGQGILTIARVLSLAATGRGLHVKQAEVHGMSQRGGAVYSHLRISDQEIFSDLIPAGQADMILAIEPLEALRYVPMLKKGGTVVASTNAEVNIPDYPAIERVLAHIAEFDQHVAIDMEKLARAAGGVLSANIVALGAASLFLGFTVRELQDAIEMLFQAKGDRVIQTNIRALRFGRTAAVAYREALDRGIEPQHARGWIATLSAEHLADEEDLDFSGLADDVDLMKLTGAEAHAFESLLHNAYDEGRSQLYEHEVYRLIELVGAITPPRHVFVNKGATIAADVLEQFPGTRVVLKLVSSQIVHKTEAGAVLILPKEIDRVRAEIDQMIARHASTSPVAGVLIVEFVEHARGLGSELFVGIRATREFGPVIAAGLGGVQTEYLASKMLPGVAVAKAVAQSVDADEFLEMFRQTAAYDILAGKTRGQERIVSDSELLRCFRAFISIARQFCVDRGEAGPDIGELEVNPFAFAGERLVPLDGRGCLRPATKVRTPRPLANAKKLLEPETIAMVGVSSKPGSFGRVILQNILESGFDPRKLTVIKQDELEFEGIRCVGRVEDLAEPADLLVVTVPASATPEIVEAANKSGKVRAGIIISGGAGETEGTEDLGAQIQEVILKGRTQDGGGAVFLGPNCMGVRSWPGKYDTFFVPNEKLPPRRSLPPQPIAIVSQSGAFVVSRLSSNPGFQPLIAASIGNQSDLTVSDLLKVIADRSDVQVIGVYLEGFADLDGVEVLKAVSELTSSGRTVVFYKAGRTESGRSAAAGHTAAVAGDYDICMTAMRYAGAYVAQDFREFGQALDLAHRLGRRTIGDGRVLAVTNAGMEAVAMADSGIKLAPLGEELKMDLGTILGQHGLAALVSPRNPLDLTPAAGEMAYGDVVQAALASDQVDAVIV
ncbi:MAG: indolepyruvate oxidoreductase subunit beta, partial [Fimbriimonadaceae bacterium]|nr:indolepyruvate oxidoreductase subunit beta [Fimbriimonadaceae bacterium]